MMTPILSLLGFIVVLSLTCCVISMTGKVIYLICVGIIELYSRATTAAFDANVKRAKLSYWQGLIDVSLDARQSRADIWRQQAQLETHRRRQLSAGDK